MVVFLAAGVTVEWLRGIIRLPYRRNPTSGGLEINRGNTVKIRVRNKALTADALLAVRYKRLINAGFIRSTESNSSIPPLNRGHKAIFTRLIQQPGPRRVAFQPSQAVPFRVSDRAATAEKLKTSGLSAWLTGSVLTVPCSPHQRVTFSEKTHTVTKRHADGTVLVIHLGVDYDDLIVNDKLPNTYFDNRKHVKKSEQGIKPKKIAPTIAGLNPSNWEPRSIRWDYEGYIEEGYKYKETLDALSDGKSILVYIYNTTPTKKTGKTEAKRADEMTSRLKNSTKHRKV